MTQRITDLTKWVWCLLALHPGTGWHPVAGVKAQNPPNNPSTVEAQAKFFQDFFSVQLSPYKIEFGHVCEDPNNWEQRYEKKDYKNHRDMGKVRWGDKKGGYGEHYWDLNHAGHNNDNDDGNYDHDHDHNSHDDGSYNEPSTNDAYDEPSEQTLTYDNDSYDLEKAAQYNERERSKRAHNLRQRPERTTTKDAQEDVYQRRVREGKRQKPVQVYNLDETEDNEEDSEEKDEPTTRRPALKTKKQHRTEEETDEYNSTPPDEPKKITLEEVHDTYPSQKPQKPQEESHGAFYKPQKPQEEHGAYYQPPKPQEEAQVAYYKPHKSQEEAQVAYFKPQKPQEEAQVAYYKPQKLQDKQFVPYEAGAGVRQHYPATVAPRLFLEPSTGHVVDRATGQAYVLQPIIPNTNYLIDQ